MIQRCKGQALVEAVVAISTVLLVVVILLPLLGKVIETNQATDQAARYMAWERTVWFQSRPSNTSNAAIKSNIELEREIHWRFFSNNESVLSSANSTNQKKWRIANDLNPMLGTWQSTDNGLVSMIKAQKGDNASSDKLVTATVTESGTPGIGGTVGDVISLLDFGGFSLNDKGYFGGKVAFEFAKLPGISPFDKDFELSANSELFVLGDGWNTSGRSHNVSMVQGLTPSSILNLGFLDTVRNALGFLSVAREMRTDWLELGKVDTEQVPEQRLCRVRGKRCR